MKGSLSKVLVLAGAAGAVAIVAAVSVAVLRLPPVESQIPAAPMIVTLTEPADGSGAGAGSTLHVSAQVVAPHSVVLVELWADRQPAGQMSPTSVGTNVYAASTDWTPTPGPHLLVVRATDAQGHIGQSNVVRIQGLVATDSMAMQPFIAQGGESLDSVAQTFGTTVEAIQDYNRGIEEGSPLEPGQELRLPVPHPYEAAVSEAPPPAPFAGDAGPAGKEVSPLGFWMGTLFAPSPTSPPAAPGLAVNTEGCDTILAIEDHSADEQGFFVYRLAPEASAFEHIATLGAHDGEGFISFRDTQLSGAFDYYVAAFNTAGETPGGIAEVIFPAETCGAATWTGSISLRGNLLVSPVVADRAYVYASVNGSQWRRIPRDPGAFLPVVRGGFDLSAHLPDLGLGATGPVQTLSLDGWGWNGGTLASLGQGYLQAVPKVTIPDVGPPLQWTSLQGSAAEKVILDPSTKTPKYFSEEVVFSKAGSFIFRWKTGSPSITGARWEVSRSPYFLPAWTVGEGVAGFEVGKEGYSYFPIPFDDLLALTANIGDLPAAPVMQGPILYGSEPSLNLGAGQSVALLPSFGGEEPAAGGEALAVGNPVLPGAGPANTWYVRLTPMVGKQIAGPVSNPVIVRYDPDQSAESQVQIPSLGPEYYTSLYDVEILDYTPGAMEDENDWGCVEVVKVEKGSLGAAMGFEVGDVHCPKGWSGDNAWSDKLGEDVGQLGGWIEKGLSYASKAWQEIKEIAIKTLMKVTGLEAVCDLAEGAVLPEGACYTVVSAAVDAGLASMGIPPTIPNFDKLMDQGLDYAAELATQEALKSLPGCVGPCEDAVREKIRGALEAGVDAVAGQSIAPSCVSEDEAHAHGREPWCPPSGVTVKPALGSIDSPPAILVQLTRRADVPDPANVPSCTLYINAMYTLKDYVKSYGPFTAQPFKGRSLPIPPLSPGESIKVAVALNDFSVVNFPWKSYIGNPWPYHDAFTMIWYSTSHATAGASFVTPPYASGAPPAPCAPTVTGEEVGAQFFGWKLK